MRVGGRAPHVERTADQQSHCEGEAAQSGHQMRGREKRELAQYGATRDAIGFNVGLHGTSRLLSELI